MENISFGFLGRSRLNSDDETILEEKQEIEFEDNSKKSSSLDRINEIKIWTKETEMKQLLDWIESTFIRPHTIRLQCNISKKKDLYRAENNKFEFENEEKKRKPVCKLKNGTKSV